MGGIRVLLAETVTVLYKLYIMYSNVTVVKFLLSEEQSDFAELFDAK